MGCGCEKGVHRENCVVGVIEEIIDAQNDIVETCCTTSCEQSINDLLGENEPATGLDTVPIILYCKDSCKPFQGYGALPVNGQDLDDIGKMRSSFIFRPKKMLNDHCAVLELVISKHDHDECNFESPCCQKTKNLRATGICITVDLNCFCHVTCLPAVSLFNN
ncbi:CotY/CotZ family spore coat protein [Virgibacillus soli]|uniref:CotY/CotZ family spore coat protein n=1 Tax=Paracerasibacillus soli TaxID=480284 RepID=A0ABU5CNI9_9BACI|nr:CotY/CotZ family spore coat protein [Virgibacillus soli]MDY0407919.1 CotY/CotZ family spore coat protein [Virgibacillus soli]